MKSRGDWAKLDVDFLDDPRMAGCNGNARLLYLASVAYCMKYQTDGVFPRSMVAVWAQVVGCSHDGRALVQLRSAGRWHEAGPDHYEVEDYLVDQVSRSEMESKRDEARERQHRHRNVTRDSGRVSRVTHITEVEGETDKENISGVSRVTSTRPRTPSRATTVPTDFVVTERMRSWAAEKVPRIVIDDQVELFINHHVAKGSSMKNWDAAFRTWLLRAKQIKEQSTPTRQVRPSVPHYDPNEPKVEYTGKGEYDEEAF